jgi:hypothetical protein
LRSPDRINASADVKGLDAGLLTLLAERVDLS